MEAFIITEVGKKIINCFCEEIMSQIVPLPATTYQIFIRLCTKQHIKYIHPKMKSEHQIDIMIKNDSFDLEMGKVNGKLDVEQISPATHCNIAFL